MGDILFQLACGCFGSFPSRRPIMNTTLQKLLSDFKATFEQTRREKLQRQDVTESEEWQKLQTQIDELLKKQDELLLNVPDSSEEHEMDRKELIKYLNENRVFEVSGFDLKKRTTKNVNTNKVLTALGGDMDEFFLLANVTQKALKDYGDTHPELKKLFKGCIEIDSETVTEVFPLEDVD